VTILALLAAFVVIQPDGWVEDAPTPRTRTFHPPGDAESVYQVSHASVAASAPAPAIMSIANDAAARIEQMGGKLISRTERVDRGRTIDEVIMELGDGVRMHMRVTYGRVGPNLEVFAGACRGRGALVQACEAKLALLEVGIDPSVDNDSIEHLLLAIAAAVTGIVLLGFAIRFALRRRDLARTSRLVEGEVVTIAGVVKPLAGTLEAPLSGRTCVLHRSRIVAATGEGLDREGVPFVVETKHGAVQVDPEKLELAVAPMTVVARATPRLDAFRARHEIDADMPASFDEIVVEPGSRITIRGVLAVVRDASAAGERGYRDDIPTTVRLDAPVTVVRIW